MKNVIFRMFSITLLVVVLLSISNGANAQFPASCEGYIIVSGDGFAYIGRPETIIVEYKLNAPINARCTGNVASADIYAGVQGEPATYLGTVSALGNYSFVWNVPSDCDLLEKTVTYYAVSSNSNSISDTAELFSSICSKAKEGIY